MILMALKLFLTLTAWGLTEALMLLLQLYLVGVLSHLEEVQLTSNDEIQLDIAYPFAAKLKSVGAVFSFFCFF